MDLLSPIFSLDQVDDLFHFSSIPFCIEEQSPIEEKTLLSKPPLCDRDVSVKPEPRKRRNLSVTCGSSEDGGDISPLKKKKIIHREVERQRRQEMAVLYESLRSKLPNEYLKGKRSVSDHMHEAVKYVQHLQKKIEGLSERRDELKRSLDQGSVGTLGPKHRRRSDLQQQTVVVETTRLGVQVLVSSISTGGVPVSRVLSLLIQEELNVVSCISTNTNGTLHHCIQCELSEGRSIDDSELQQKLLRSISG